jgi:osmotically inducible protein OsmC
MPQLEKVLYTGKTHTSGGRDGTSRSSDGRLDVRLSSPGTPGTGTNPEQLLGGRLVGMLHQRDQARGRKTKVSLPASVAIDAEVDLCHGRRHLPSAGSPQHQSARVGRDAARALVDAAHQACPFSKATRGNVDVAINVL